MTSRHPGVTISVGPEGHRSKPKARRWADVGSALYACVRICVWNQSVYVVGDCNLVQSTNADCFFLFRRRNHTRPRVNNEQPIPSLPVSRGQRIG